MNQPTYTFAIEVGDQITATYDGSPTKIITVAKVVSRRGRVRRVVGDDKQEHALRVSDGGHIGEVEHSTHGGYRRTLPGDEKVIADAWTRAKLRTRFERARIDNWPIEDVQRVLDAWPNKAVTK